MKILAHSRRTVAMRTQWRSQRFGLFESLISSLPRPLKILDVGGEQEFWENLGFVNAEDIHIVLLNVHKEEVKYPNFSSIAGDARDLGEFEDNEFDIVFSNSVIEHVGAYHQQGLMAREIRRVGKRYFVQTPNRFFPIEPHFYFPCFQFLPFSVRVFLVSHFNVGMYRKRSDRQEAESLARSIHLLSQEELKQLFPGAEIYKEKVFNFVKSFTVYEGWNRAETSTI